MNWKLFIARRIYKNNDGNKEVSKPAVRIAMAGISIGLAVMIVSVAVVIGFKNQVRDKVVGLASEVIITSLDDAQLYMTAPIQASDSLMEALSQKPDITHVQRYSVKPGMIMTSDNFQGMVVKGVGQEYDLSYIREHIVEGEIPVFTDTVATNSVIISKSIADKLNIKTGDRIYTYYVDDNVRARRLTVSAIYQTNFSAFDDYFLLTDIYTVNRLNKWEADQVSGIEINVDDYSRIDAVNDDIRTGTNMIGVLKAMGADNNSIRKIFLSFSVFLIGRGMLWGNVIGLSLCLIQYFFEPVKLDPSVYYVSSVPIELNVLIYILLNLFTLIVSVLMLVGPSYLISRIHPARSIRYE